MNSQIAVLLDKENQITDFFNMYWIVIYMKGEKWQIQKIISFNEEKINRGERIRAFTEEVIKVLQGYHLVVGKLITGMPYYLLTKAGYEVLEAETLSTKLLEQINQDYNREKEDSEREITKEIPKKPVLIDDTGHYFLDIIALQKAYPTISTKKALLPFFINKSYQSITLVCNHMMPWLEHFVEEHQLEVSIKRGEGKCIVKISGKLCS